MKLPKHWGALVVVFSCKIHAVTDALSLPVHFILTGGQAADITQVIPLIEGISTGALLANKGYDADTSLDWLKECSIAAVIPPKANRKVQTKCSWYLCKERHVVECMFGRLEYYRRIVTHFKKKTSYFKEMLVLSSSSVVIMLTRQQSLNKSAEVTLSCSLVTILSYCEKLYFGRRWLLCDECQRAKRYFQLVPLFEQPHAPWHPLRSR